MLWDLSGEQIVSVMLQFLNNQNKIRARGQNTKMLWLLTEDRKASDSCRRTETENVIFALILLDQVTAQTSIFMNGGIKHSLSTRGGIFKVKCLYFITLLCLSAAHLCTHTHTHTHTDIYDILICMVFKDTNDVNSFVKLDKYTHTYIISISSSWTIVMTHTVIITCTKSILR